MSQRTITDAEGRAWTCTAADTRNAGAPSQGQDVVLTCATDSVAEPIHVTVGWQWERMSAHGLARLVSQASPPPRQ